MKIKTMFVQLATSRSSAETTRGTGVTVNSVHLVQFFTEGVGEFLDNFKMTEDQFFKEDRPSSINQRFAKPEEIAFAYQQTCGRAM